MIAIVKNEVSVFEEMIGFFFIRGRCAYNGRNEKDTLSMFVQWWLVDRVSKANPPPLPPKKEKKGGKNSFTDICV